ncbi:hypothetical protein BG005_000970 [Podila minutissima]|nr:hypothetical protein BG005_000970 [Podila minutissima]
MSSTQCRVACIRGSATFTSKEIGEKTSIMKVILYFAAILAVVGVTVATQDSCWCEPTYVGEPSRKSPDCCY